MTTAIPTDRALELARESGFDLAGVAPLEPPPDATRFHAWLDAGRHAGMSWMERDRERIADPRRVLPGGRSLLVVGLAHARAAVELPGGGRVARYAAGRDYHNLMTRRLRALARALEAEGAGARRRIVVDAGPVLERAHAARAGLGFPSKAANLLHPSFGPWFFLGEILLEVELDPTPTPPAGSCGTCTACLDACPTGAILRPGEVDANLCLSYHTIENRGEVPHELRPALGEWAFGCDVCSEVCPWGATAADSSERFGTHETATSGLVRWLELTPETFPEAFRGSPLSRPKRDGLLRNAAIVLGNRPGEEGRRALLQALTFDPAPLVREAAAWGLVAGHAADRGVLPAVDRALAREPDAGARAGMRRSLEGSD